MMRREFYNEGQFYRPVMVDRFGVVPGQSVEIASDVHWLSDAFDRPILTGGLQMVAAFYVPYRLLWDGWVDFVTQGDIGGSGSSAPTATVPYTIVPWAMIGEGGAASNRAVSVFGRRAYKLIVNQYFGDANYPTSYYSATQFEDDTYINQKQARNIDQFLSSIVRASDVESETWTVPVSGATATINLNALRTELVRAKSMKRRDMTGDKYVDALMRMGVKLDWRVQQAPECLGIWKGNFVSDKIQATSTDATGKTVSQFRGSLRCRTGRKFFAEHGLVMLIGVIKPTLLDEPFIAPDATVISKNQMFWGDNQVGVGAVDTTWIEPGSPQAHWPNFAQWFKGRSGIGDRSSKAWCMRASAVNLEEAIYPPSPATPDVGQLDRAFAVICYTANKTFVPFSKNII